MFYLKIIGEIGFWAWFLYAACANLWWFTKIKLAHEVMLEMRPVALVGTAFKLLINNPIIYADSPRWMTLVMICDAFWIWIIWNEKDDRWKKRRKKVAARVKEVAGRLVVVPVPEPVPITIRRST